MRVENVLHVKSQIQISSPWDWINLVDLIIIALTKGLHWKGVQERANPNPFVMSTSLQLHCYFGSDGDFCYLWKILKKMTVMVIFARGGESKNLVLWASYSKVGKQQRKKKIFCGWPWTAHQSKTENTCKKEQKL